MTHNDEMMPELRSPRRSKCRVLGMAAVVLALTATAGGCGGKETDAAAKGGSSSTTPTTAAASRQSATTAGPVAGGGGGTGACGLISTAEAAQMAKTAVQPGVEQSFPAAPGVSASFCTYNFSPGNAPAVLIVVAKGQTVFEQMRQDDASDSSFEEVSGIGDAAYRCCGGNLKVRHGDTALTLSIGQMNGVPGDTPIEDVKRLAALVISRL